MQTVDTAEDLKLVSKMIPRLATTDDGEVIATVRAIGRVLQRAKLDWHDIASAVYRPMGETVCENFHWDLTRWARVLKDLKGGGKNEREDEFIRGVLRRVRGGRLPSEKQIDWIVSILERTRYQ